MVQSYAPYCLVRHKASWNSTANSFLDSKYNNSFKSATFMGKSLYTIFLSLREFYGEINRTLAFNIVISKFITILYRQDSN